MAFLTFDFLHVYAFFHFLYSTCIVLYSACTLLLAFFKALFTYFAGVAISWGARVDWEGGAWEASMELLML